MNIGFSEEDANTIHIYKGKGCSKCNNTGYKGRVGLFEVMPVTTAIRTLCSATQTTPNYEDSHRRRDDYPEAERS